MRHGPRRFIAGAVCPRCGEMDRIVMYRNEHGQFRACVNCQFQDRMPDEGIEVTAPETRVTRPAVTANDIVQPVRIFPPPAKPTDKDPVDRDLTDKDR